MYDGVAPRGSSDPQVKCSLDTRTKIVPYTIIFKLVPTFKLVHQSEVTVSSGKPTISGISIQVEDGDVFFLLFKVLCS